MPSKRSKNRAKLLLLDGYSLAFRAFYALPEDLMTSDGTHTNAAYGFTSMLIWKSRTSLRYWPGSASPITYNNTALWLNTLEKHLGWPTLQKAMATYFDRWKFRHPKQQVRNAISPIASPDHVQIVPGLPKTRSGKIMRRILRQIAAADYDQLGDVSTLADPSVVDKIVAEHRAQAR